MCKGWLSLAGEEGVVVLEEVVGKGKEVLDGSSSTSSGSRVGVVVVVVVMLLSVGLKLDWGASVSGGDCDCDCVVLLLISSEALTPVTNTLYHLVARGGGQDNFAVILFSP